MNSKLVLKKVLKVSGRFVDYYLHGDRSLSPRRAKNLAEYLGVPITHILFPKDYGIDIPTFLSKAITDKQKTMEAPVDESSRDPSSKEDCHAPSH